MKRIKRKQLKEDEFITTINKIMNFAKKRARELLAFGVVIILAILIFAGARFIKVQNIKKESRMLGQILELQSNLDEGPENLKKLEELAVKGKYSRLASLLLAGHWVEKGDFDKAQKSIQKVTKGKRDIFYFQAQDLLAQIHMKQMDFDKAINIYKKIEEENPEEYALDAVLYRLADAHEQKGNVEEALALYKRVQQEYPQTYFGYDASQKINKLEPKK